MHSKHFAAGSVGDFSFTPKMLDLSEGLTGKRAVFRVGTRSFPYLKDHGFHDMAVLPGSAYIQMASITHQSLNRKAPSILKNISFKNPIILLEEDTSIEVVPQKEADGSVIYRFFVEGLESGESESDRKASASVEIDSNSAFESERSSQEFSIDRFQNRAASVIESESFYMDLRKNGNQYGPHFQNLEKIWLASDQALGKLSVSDLQAGSKYPFIHPTFIDSIAQLLSAFILNLGRTFVLTTIKEVIIYNTEFPGDLWALGQISSGDQPSSSGFSGDVRVLDNSGKVYLVLTGASFDYLDRVKPAIAFAPALYIASTFTAEPILDSLKFWSDYFDSPIRIQFAPYNQVYQQLLDDQSLFRKNEDGLNIILLGLEDWAQKEEPATLKASQQDLEILFKNKDRYVLPNELEIVHLNKYETDYIYKEIFDDKCYLKHGIRLKDGDTVIDIGANIGLFSLFANLCCKNPRVLAYEPSPVVYELLKANCDAYGRKVQTFNCGVSDCRKTAEFTFYEKSSVFSSFYSDEKEDQETIRAVVRNMLKKETSIDAATLEEYVNELTKERLVSKTYVVQLISISDIIQENRIEYIDLLKIDAEKSELDILKGIQEADWPKIKQIVIEIHDKSQESLKLVKTILSEKGFRFIVEQEQLLEESGLYNIYAVREPAEKTSNYRGFTDANSENALHRNISEFGEALESFIAVSTVPMIVGVCPRTPNIRDSVELEAFFDKCEKILLSRVERITNVYPIDSSTLLNRYPSDGYYDPEGDYLGHMPYTNDFYTSLGTSLYRMVFNLKNNPFKVIVLDCDNTIWKGVCGEDGPLGIEVSEPYLRLQDFMIRQMDSGMLICLCSKNSETDVFEVFERRDDMPLKREHLVSWRINWNMKSENLKSLAEELNLGLDSFVFIDDNPVECAEVRINCPQVLTLQLPKDQESITTFLENIWALDHIKTTAEDKKRTRMYKENVQREKYREQAFSLQDFLDGLQLNIRMSSPIEEQIDRVSQLTYRTNQFNLTTIRRSKSEIKRLIDQENFECLVTHVSDRFGDYGLVSVLLYEDRGEHYVVDTFLLSCRVLGRGVEYKILALFGKRALEKGKKFIEFKYVQTEKNLPAFDFINSIGLQYKKESQGFIYRIPADILSNLEYAPQSNGEVKLAKSKKMRGHAKTLSSGSTLLSERLQRIGDELTDLISISNTIEKHRTNGKRAEAVNFTKTVNEHQLKLSDIWLKVLGKSIIDINDNFFELGGTSLMAVQIIAMIKKQMKINLPITSLFECPTVKLMAVKIQSLKNQKELKKREKPQQRGNLRRVKMRDRFIRKNKL